MTPKLLAYYLSCERVLNLIDNQGLPFHVQQSLLGLPVSMSSAILSNDVGAYVLKAISRGEIKTLQELQMDGGVRQGQSFIYNGKLRGKGFGFNNKTPALEMSTILPFPLENVKFSLEFSRSGLVNDTAYTRLSGPSNIFVFAYVVDVSEGSIRAIPIVIGDLVDSDAPFASSLSFGISLRPEEVEQFSAVDRRWTPSKSEFELMRTIPEKCVKDLICYLLDQQPQSDWGGEESDIFTSGMLVDGKRMTGAFLLKGPAKFHPMTPRNLGKNGDQIYRLFNVPADIYVIQHCHSIEPSVRGTAEAFALRRMLTAPCRVMFIDGWDTARLLKAHGLWPKLSLG
ncbi:methyltransferase [Pseudomonas syringae]|uniref:methyltransferase n=1 Tax=Pseudomonas syringae TaxID=317 RepID=UPI003F74D1A7